MRTAPALLLPALYAAGLLLALVTPGYDSARNIASLLGAAGAPHAAAFNALMIASGVAGLVAGVAWPARGLAERLFAAATALVGLGNVWAGLFPLPDPRHLANPLLPAFVALPLLAMAAGWRDRGLRSYLLTNAVLFAALALLRAANGEWAGAVQRLHAATVYLPVAVIAWRTRAR